MKVKIEVMLRDAILDPQGNTIKKSLNSLGFKNVKNVRQGKLIEVDLNSNSPIKEKKKIEKMCEDVLTNSLTEKYKIKFLKNK
ncbi:MAG: Phosphoribosylformylglycinamidine synthase subunit PurS [Alphaproteobacteria bacterium MarineAlpha6_Bin6]|nr:phosphoribosylformylglycinamidine synthase [Pelagibacteraceae bacterium]PPR30857.1 MAG: Phosphoribosylformylglycinamidine synthase subunit PurS [Alphaproteobacteria bacterium MarineAlpha6_Bin6]PPR32448.1 MAG: Phosphoribosylformylglycinamidine synthase subunit PurS [Alphaproteobacteria bacterium MarineAlpha6_Bin5]|tara:strand:+ start:604 stop:852 length:249 start_codon:yes stop_codon:yes gene_type:complete